jgi:hypothetical protein
MRAMASPSTRRPPPHRRCGELTAKPRTSISRAHQHYMSPYIPFLQFVCQFSSARPKPHCRPSPSTPATLGIAVGSYHQAPLSPHRPLCELPRSLLVPTDPLVLSNFSRSPVTDECRRCRLRPRCGTSLSSLPQVQLTPHRASTHRQEAFRPLLRHPRAPEHSPRCSYPTASRRSLSCRRYKLPHMNSKCLQVRKGSLVPPLSFPLAAGDRRRRITPVKPHAPSLTETEDLGLEGAKAQGAICKP